MFNDKETFILAASSQVYQAKVALEAYILKEQMPLYDTIIAFVAETKKAHSDFFTEYSLTLGKQSQGLNTFRTNMQALTDKSKLLGTNPPNKEAADALLLQKTLILHSGIHEKVTQLT